MPMYNLPSCLKIKTHLALCLVLVAGLLISSVIVDSGAFAQVDEKEAQKLEQTLAVSERSLSFIARFITENSDDDTLIGARSKLTNLLPTIENSLARVEERRSVLAQQLEQLGTAPTEGVTEDPKVTEERNKITAERQSLSLLVTKRDELLKKTNDMLDEVAQLRSDLFRKQLTKRTHINSGLFENLVVDTSLMLSRIQNYLKAWYNFTLSRKPYNLILALLVALGASFGFRWLAGRVVNVAYGPDVDLSRLQKIIRALSRTIFPSLLLAITLSTLLAVLYFMDMIPDNILRVLDAIFFAAFGIYFVSSFCRNVLAPQAPELRIIPLSDYSAKRFSILVVAMAVVHAADFVVGRLAEATSAPLSFTIANSFIAAMLIGLLLVSMLMVRQDKKARKPAISRLVRLPLILASIAIFAAALSGYIGLSRFIAQQIVVTSTIIATMMLGYVASRDLTQAGAFGETAIGQKLADRYDLGEERLDQIGLGSSIILMLAVFLIGIPAIMMQWGTRLADIWSWAQQLFFGIKIGDFKFSLSGVLYGILVFLIIFLITRLMQNWMTNTVLARTKVDSGVKNSIRTGIGYAGIALALVLGVTSAGVNLSSLAIVAGALSLGIGFGLQNIVSNFVSGLILLVERPIKVGDFVEAGTIRGTVKKISVRATEVETPNNLSIILPNSELINSAVGNWTHKRRSSRIDLNIGFAYGTSPSKVRDILMQVADEHPDVMKVPEPFVFFQGYGASSIDVQLRVHLRDFMILPRVQTELFFAITEAFEENGIEIPFPQRDLHLRSIDADLLKKLAK